MDQAELVDLQASSISSAGTKSRGRKKIPERWTRVISLEQDDLENVKTYELASDLILG